MFADKSATIVICDNRVMIVICQLLSTIDVEDDIYLRNDRCAMATLRASALIIMKASVTFNSTQILLESEI